MKWGFATFVRRRRMRKTPLRLFSPRASQALHFTAAHKKSNYHYYFTSAPRKRSCRYSLHLARSAPTFVRRLFILRVRERENPRAN
jgi:hypothetical protein